MFHLITYRNFVCAFCLMSILPSLYAQQVTFDIYKASKPRLQHATKYNSRINVNDYWVSEKLDGVRGYWTGEKLVTRNGNNLNPPKWFVEHWPKVAMEGELWSARGQFEQTSACIRRKKTNKLCWKDLKLMIFDLPHQVGSFTQRISMMKLLIEKSSSAHLFMIEQKKVSNNASLTTWLTKVVSDHGEGLMLHLANANYHSGRTKNLLKLKQHQDAEAVVIAHLPGKGKYSGLLGAIKVKTPDGIVFKIGSGFSDLERKHPPKIGSVITYKYIGKTQRGVPKFASFLRIRHTL